MKKIQTLTIILVALFAISAMLATIASAETTLLAEWLNDGATIPAGTHLATVSEGEIIFEDAKAGLAFLCSFEFHGTVGNDGEDEITLVTALKGTTDITLTTSLPCASDKFCEAGADLFFSPEKLPWPTRLILMENGTFLDVIFGLAYFFECLVLGIKVSEECSAAQIGGEVINITGGVEEKGKPSPNVNCTTGGTGTGSIEFIGPNITKLTAGGPLTVSSE
jgi:hypothetical protein